MKTGAKWKSVEIYPEKEGWKIVWAKDIGSEKFKHMMEFWNGKKWDTGLETITHWLDIGEPPK